MLPNLELFLLALLHASLVSCVLLLCIFLALVGLLTAAVLTLLSVFLIDVYDRMPLVLFSFSVLCDNLKLGLILVILMVTHLAVNIGLTISPRIQSAIQRTQVRGRFLKDRT